MMVPLFKGLPDAQMESLSRISRIRVFHRGDAIFSEKETANGFYIANKGRVKVYKLSAEGKEQILHIINEKEPFGEVPVFTGATFPAHAEAMEHCEVIFIPRDSFIELIARDPSLALNMLALLSRRLKEFTVLVEDLSLKEVPQRLASFLLYLSTGKNAKEEIRLTVTKGQLASLLGTIPETLSRILARMSTQGIITVRGRTISVHDRQALEDIGNRERVLL